MVSTNARTHERVSEWRPDPEGSGGWVRRLIQARRHRAPLLPPKARTADQDRPESASRFKVARELDEALSTGMVENHHPQPRFHRRSVHATAAAIRTRTRLGRREEKHTPDDVPASCKGHADCCKSILREEDVLGVDCGCTLKQGGQPPDSLPRRRRPRPVERNGWRAQLETGRSGSGGSVNQRRRPRGRLRAGGATRVLRRASTDPDPKTVARTRGHLPRSCRSAHGPAVSIRP